jgi:hypothetical protein
VRLQRHDLLRAALARHARLPLLPEHQRDVRTVHIGVEQADPASGRRQRHRQVHRHRRLADAALPRAHRNDVADARNQRVVRRRGRYRARLQRPRCCVGAFGRRTSIFTFATPSTASAAARASRTSVPGSSGAQQELELHLALSSADRHSARARWRRHPDRAGLHPSSARAPARDLSRPSLAHCSGRRPSSAAAGPALKKSGRHPHRAPAAPI